MDWPLLNLAPHRNPSMHFYVEPVKAALISFDGIGNLQKMQTQSLIAGQQLEIVTHRHRYSYIYSYRYRYSCRENRNNFSLVSVRL